ncbi:conserved hypothetical protein [Trichinella spiralis]|uniref:hypothetical protein n=1 Tax=Trichinella spiralis TaxID=6334 RepID=UPI0001EFECF1|nr:conserved hypothetical protein [Trichinella spiralis]
MDITDKHAASRRFLATLYSTPSIVLPRHSYGQTPEMGVMDTDSAYNCICTDNEVKKMELPSKEDYGSALVGAYVAVVVGILLCQVSDGPCSQTLRNTAFLSCLVIAIMLPVKRRHGRREN